MQFVQVINRTNQKLHGLWDGRHVDLPPGLSHHQEQAAIAYKRQNPLMGTSDPTLATNMDLVVGDAIYKIGIVEHGDDCSPLDKTDEGLERWNRTALTGARPTEVVQGIAGLYRPNTPEASPRMPIDGTGFVNPNS